MAHPQYGFDRGLKPLKILSATFAKGPLMFLMKWQGIDQADLVLAKDAMERCPHLITEFYAASPDGSALEVNEEADAGPVSNYQTSDEENMEYEPKKDDD